MSPVFAVRRETEPGFERMRTLEDVPPVFAVRRAHFERQETEPGFERMRTLEDAPSVFAVRRAHFEPVSDTNQMVLKCVRPQIFYEYFYRQREKLISNILGG